MCTLLDQTLQNDRTGMLVHSKGRLELLDDVQGITQHAYGHVDGTSHLPHHANTQALTQINTGITPPASMPAEPFVHCFCFTNQVFHKS